jgi:hypothetical protein
MRVRMNTKALEADLANLVEYSVGYLDGIQKGKKEFLNGLGVITIQALGQYIDASARGNREALHHVYEWYQEGSPSARLFDLQYTVSNLGLSIGSTFRQSSTMSRDANKPFYDKARIMELGLSVIVKPKGDNPLVFEAGGETVFTKKPVTIEAPGGIETQGSYERVFDQFMLQYFKQSFLKASGIYDYIKKPVLYKKNFKAGIKGGGRSKGYQTGYRWIANATTGVDISA